MTLMSCLARHDAVSASTSKAPSTIASAIMNPSAVMPRRPQVAKVGSDEGVQTALGAGPLGDWSRQTEVRGWASNVSGNQAERARPHRRDASRRRKPVGWTCELRRTLAKRMQSRASKSAAGDGTQLRRMCSLQHGPVSGADKAGGPIERKVSWGRGSDGRR
jgi:hypothetical protein